MKHQSPIVAVALIAALALAPASLMAAGKKKTEASPAPSTAASPAATATKAPRAIPFHGMVSAVDQKAKTFTIAGKTSTRVFKITDKTTISKSGASATMNDIVANEEIRGSYWKQADGSLEAKTVKVGPAEKKEKKEKKSKKEKSEESPAASTESPAKPQ